jgi:hypothetical protein
MSALVGNKGSKSGIVGDGGRVNANNISSSRTSASGTGTVVYTGVGFSPKAGISCGYVAGGSGVGWGAFSSTPTGSSSNNLIGQSGNGVQHITSDYLRWEGPWISHNDTSPSNEGQLFRNTGGGSSDCRWQYKVTAISDDGLSIYWHKVDATNVTCSGQILVLR